MYLICDKHSLRFVRSNLQGNGIPYAVRQLPCAHKVRLDCNKNCVAMGNCDTHTYDFASSVARQRTFQKFLAVL